MSDIRSYRDLIVWQKARELVKKVYEGSESFPRNEVFGLTQQMRRAAVSVPSNIAEGYGRGSRPEYIRFLHIARGSLYEIETQLLLAEDLGYLSGDVSRSLQHAAESVSKLLYRLLASLRKQPPDAS